MLKLKFRFHTGHRDGFPALGTLDNVFIDLTNRCNLRCGYCFNYEAVHGTTRDLSLSVLERLVTDPMAASISNWFLSGGEPLSYPYLDEALQLFQRHGIHPKIATNGSLMTPATVERWTELGVGSVQFSIDTLDASRAQVLRGGSESTLPRTLANLELAIASPLRTVAASVLTKVNYADITGMMAHFASIGVDSYTVYLYTPGSDLPYMHPYYLAPREVLEISDGLIQYYARNFSAGSIDTNFPWLTGSPLHDKWRDQVELRVHGCGAGQFTVSVKSDGTLSPCICQSSAPFICGDLNTSSLSAIWQSPELETYRSDCYRVPECEGCAVLSACRGGCRSNAFVFGQAGLRSFDSYCSTFRSTNVTTPGDN